MTNVTIFKIGSQTQRDSTEAIGGRRKIILYIIIMMVSLQLLFQTLVTFDDYILSVSFLLNAVNWMKRV